MRGKQTTKQTYRPDKRITPADAGKTAFAVGYCVSVEDHPRRCGENSRSQAGRRHRLGSPPQVRGKLQAATGAVAQKRITPAGAGKTRRGNSISGRNKDHPRRCGENRRAKRLSASFRGSPPQVRGKPFYPPAFAVAQRITPAGAGKTLSPNIGRGRFLDHPRRCGENTLSILCRLISRGSPPQVRGKRRSSALVSPKQRITPADAGKTVCTTTHTPVQWDHPRGCGENS